MSFWAEATISVFFLIIFCTAIYLLIFLILKLLISIIKIYDICKKKCYNPFTKKNFIKILIYLNCFNSINFNNKIKPEIFNPNTNNNQLSKITTIYSIV